MVKDVGPTDAKEEAVAEMKRLVEQWEATSALNTTELYLFTEALVGAARALLTTKPAQAEERQTLCDDDKCRERTPHVHRCNVRYSFADMEKRKGSYGCY